MIVFDSTYLIVLLRHDLSSVAIVDRQNKPVTKVYERVEYLVRKLSNSNSLICIPTPVLAEIMIRAGSAGPEYLKRFSNSAKFKLSPFDVKAAVEAAELIKKVKAEQRAQPIETWAKTKFDIQIVAIAKGEDSPVIYSEDHQVENHATRLGISVKRICDLEVPPEQQNIFEQPAGAEP
ncbi:MAG TPA: PIN domain-containing protein [Candidatus Angelobacter sp.]